ncbi:MAG: NADH-quinone oxidoreductase subunit J [Proteobacteria bacterium]|nr:NADH-quinone oxidoreductase subunit J [Pseudomonadota bacterium]
MSVEAIVFYVFASALVFAASMVITVRNPVHAALFLIMAFFASAGLWILLEAEFLAITLVLVYVGAVMVLFLFVVMMLDINLTVLREGFARYLPIAFVVALGMMVSLGLIVGKDNFGLDAVGPAAKAPASYSNTEELGRVLYTDYVFPFEIAAVILLVAIIAAIALTLRPTRQTKAPNPDRQVAVKRGDRIRIVKMDSEK